ncbi:5769_t:CDS:2, partial [Gigaspora rosea]
ETSDKEALEKHNKEFYNIQADSNPNKPDVVLVDIVLKHIDLTYVLHLFDMYAKVVLKSFSIVDKISDAGLEFKHLAAFEGYRYNNFLCGLC